MEIDSVLYLHIKKMRELYLIFTGVLISAYGFSQDSIPGCYSSNFAIIGWFGTHLKLNQDSTFEYLFAGDLFYDKASGIYTRDKNTVFLTFDKPLRDSLKLEFKDSLGVVSKYTIVKPANVAEKSRPSKLYYRNEKLFLYDNSGKRIRKKMDAENKRRKYYLLRHPNHTDVEW